MGIKTITTVAVILACLVYFERSAVAATRSLCFNLAMLDDARTDCPQPGTPGIKRACQADNFGTNTDRVVGWAFDVYDDDGGGSHDDYIGTWVTTNPGGLNCVSFEWENSTYDGGEAHPDLYIVVTNSFTSSATSTGGPGWGTIATSAGTGYPYISFRFNRANNCTGTCFIDTDGTPGAPYGALKPFTSTATDHAQAMLVGDSAQRAFEVFGSKMDPGFVFVRYPNTDPTFPGTGSQGRTIIRVAPNDLRGSAVTHELGHTVHKQLFEQDNLTDSACVANGDGWSAGSFEWQGCATKEGWASYVAAVSWWNPASASASPRLDDPVLGSFFIEPAEPVNCVSGFGCGGCPPCGDNRWHAGQVTKAFWDYDDVNNEVGCFDSDGDGSIDNDVSSDASASFYADIWDYFGDGTANMQDREADNNGVNMWDWLGNEEAFQPAVVKTFMHHNCLTLQDQN